MERPDLATLACVPPEYYLFRQGGQANLVIRKVYGHARRLGVLVGISQRAGHLQADTVEYGSPRPQVRL